MSPKSLFFLLAVGLCATQMVSAHREARGISGFFSTAKNKLAQLLHSAEDSTLSSINTVKDYIIKLENNFLESGTKALNKAGIDVNLNDLAALLKDNVKVCAKDETVKAEAKVILNDMASCVTKDVATLKKLVTDMEDLWETAQSMPSAIKDVAAHCNSDAVAEEPLDLTVTLDTSNHELAEANNELLLDASKHLSKRALWDLSRMTSCIKNVFNYAKDDLISIPGEIITVATSAYKLVNSVQTGIPACVSKKAALNAPAISKLGIQLSACVAAGVANGDLSSSPALAGAATAIKNIQGSSALDAANQLTQLLG